MTSDLRLDDEGEDDVVDFDTDFDGLFREDGLFLCACDGDDELRQDLPVPVWDGGDGKCTDPAVEDDDDAVEHAAVAPRSKLVKLIGDVVAVSPSVSSLFVE